MKKLILSSWSVFIIMILAWVFLNPSRVVAEIVKPTTAVPIFEEFIENTDVMIEYRLTQEMILGLDIQYGMVTLLEIFHEDDPAVPVYTDYDPHVSFTTPGQPLLFHWNGYTNALDWARPGRYTVRISLLNHALDPLAWTVEEEHSIILAVTDVGLLPASDAYVARHGLRHGTDDLELHYETSPVVSYDEVVTRIYNDADEEIARYATTSDLDGDFAWNGWTLEREIVEPGVYSAEIEIKRRGMTLGASIRHTFTVYEVDLQAVGVFEDDEEAPGIDLPAGEETVITLTFEPSGTGLAGTVHVVDETSRGSVIFSASGASLDLVSGEDFALADLGGAGMAITAQAIRLDPEVTQVLAHYLPPGAPVDKTEADSIVLVLSSIDIDADADRDGIVETTHEDDVGEDVWMRGVHNKGAIVLVNSDDDDNDGLPDNWTDLPDIEHDEWDGHPHDNTINTDPDRDDIAPLVVRKINLPALPDGAQITLRVVTPVDDPAYFVGIAADHRIRIFLPNSTSGDDHVYVAGAQEIIGPDSGNSATFVAVPAAGQQDSAIFLGEGDVRFGIEGLVHGSMVDIIIEYLEPAAGIACSDRLQMKVAPFIVASHTKDVDLSPGAGETVFVDNRGVHNEDMRMDLRNAFGTAYLDEASTGDLWHQDGYEPGYQSAPYQSMPLIFGLPRGQRGGDLLNDYVQTELLRPGLGVVHNFQYLNPWVSQDDGGNLEAIPGDPEYFHYGDEMSDIITDFLNAQGVQRAMEVDTSFLAVGHVDEVSSFCPDGRHVLMASPEVAWGLMLIAGDIDAGAMMMQGIELPDFGGVAVGITVTQAMDMYEDYNFNVVLDPYNLPRLRNTLGQGSAASRPQGDPGNATDHVALMRAGGLIGFMTGDQTRTFRITFSDDTNFAMSYRDGDSGGWTADGNGRYGENFLCNSRTAFILHRWWQAPQPAPGDIYTFTVNLRTAFIEVPVFFHNSGGGGGAVAASKNNVNSLIDNDTIISPLPVGPVVDWGIGARDIFSYYIEQVFNRAGYSRVIFTDEMLYHNRLGSVHCATNAVREIPARHWWK
ncbi:MAG: hypothetical protein GY833_18785 [Aestuariibacter sp.]|nr:hypothetical protein [Aestuariibacter sp.]